MTPKNPFNIYDSQFARTKRRANLDWEEGALFNAQDPDDYYEGHEPEVKTSFYIASLALVFGILLVRLFYLQIANGDEYRALADNNRLRTQAIIAPRGIIFDSQGKPLVENVPSFELVASPIDLPEENIDEVISRVKMLVDFDVEKFKKEYQAKKNSFQGITVAVNIPKEVAVQLEANAGQYPGFSVSHNPIRNYLNAPVFSHVLGYTGKITDKELEQNKEIQYAFNDYIGKTGIELSYEKYLRGVHGRKQLEVDATGKVKADKGEVQPEPGNSLVLNIDGELQKVLYDQMVARNGNKKAAAVAVHPQTGAVLALVSLPGFDNNLFSKGISQEDYNLLVNDPREPLFNRAITGTYPPGSTIKPVVLTGALQEEIIDENTIIVDNGSISYGNFLFRGWKLDGLGPMDARGAIAWSSDIYFYTIGGGQASLNIQGLGPDKIAEYSKLFGMGQRLGIDLPGEQPGLVPTPQWKREYFDDPAMKIWYPGDTYHVSIGQGNMLSTPLQVTMWTATVANGGSLFKPRILDKVLDEQGNAIFETKPEVIRAGFIDPKNIEIAREGMRETVTEGTARSLNTLPINVAGKTGTAQFDGADPSATHAWFTAFAPYEDPQIAITVLVEAGGEGSAAASPVVKETLKWWAENRYNR